MNNKMKAIRLDGPCEPEELVVTEVSIPEIKPGWVRIKIKAFGINESEVTSRKGGSDKREFSFPRILGIEGVGIIDKVTGSSNFKVGQKVITMMGGMGRSFDGSYAEYLLVPEKQVIPFTSDLPWETLGALPETFQTAYGSLQTLNLNSGQALLIRGGTSTVGLAAAALANTQGIKVISTTRNKKSFAFLKKSGAKHAIEDNGKIEEEVLKIAPQGADAAIELVGLSTLQDTFRSTREKGTVCFTGSLDGKWTIDNFYPFNFIPSGKYLTVYAGNASNLPAKVFDEIISFVKNKKIDFPTKVYHGLNSVAQAQYDLENNTNPGKHVVVLD